MSCYLCGSQVAEKLTKQKALEEQIHCPTCGTYTVSIPTPGLLEKENNQKYILSALTRDASDRGTPLTLTTENIQSSIESVHRPTSPLENMDRVLLLVMKRQTRADEIVDPNLNTDYPLVFAHDAQEYQYFLETLMEQSLLETPERSLSHLGRVGLTPAGWQRALELQKTQRDSDQAFVAMWFAAELTDAWENGFKPALESTGFRPYRVDQSEHNDKIDDRIIAEIRRSGLLVADFTGHRGGVYFEAGFALGLGIPVIWTCRKDEIEKAHFDTRQYNHIVWTNPSEIKDKLALRIDANNFGKKVSS